MKLEQLRYFMEAVKYKSISVAADENYISQPTFSSAITKLEKELGVALLRRTSRGVSPTQAGEIVLEKAEQIFRTIEDMTQEVSMSDKTGVIKLSAVASFYNQIIPHVLLNINKRNLNLSLHVSTAESAQIINNVSSGVDNIGVIIHSERLMSSSANLEYFPLFDDEFLLYVGKNSPFWDSESVSMEEILLEPYIAYRDEFQKENAIWTESLELNGKTPNIKMRTDDLEFLKKMISEGDYVAFFPKFMSLDDFYVNHGLIRAIPIHDRKLKIQVGYIHSNKYRLSQIDQSFLELMKETIEEMTCDKDILCFGC